MTKQPQAEQQKHATPPAGKVAQPLKRTYLVLAEILDKWLSVEWHRPLSSSSSFFSFSCSCSSSYSSSLSSIFSYPQNLATISLWNYEIFFYFGKNKITALSDKKMLMDIPAGLSFPDLLKHPGPKLGSEASSSAPRPLTWAVKPLVQHPALSYEQWSLYSSTNAPHMPSEASSPAPKPLSWPVKPLVQHAGPSHGQWSL